MLTTEQIIEYLKSALFVYDPEEVGTDLEEVDPQDIHFSDDYLKAVLQVALSKFNPDIELEEMETSDLYLVVLLARREIYLYLATRSAPLYDLSIAGATGSSRIDRSQRFNHYMQLIKYVDEEYENYIKSGGGGSGQGDGEGGGIGFPIHSGNILLDRKYFTERNYNLYSNPKVTLRILKATPEGEVYFSWKLRNIRRLDYVRVYISDEPIVDEFAEKKLELYKPLKPVFQTRDKKKDKYRVEKLELDKDYYIAVVVREQNGLVGYQEKSFSLELPEKEEEVDKDEK